MPRHSHQVNQPDRFSVNSFDDPTLAQNPQESGFNVVLNTPLLNVKGVQLQRATIPQATVNIMDYQLVFWYYRLPTVNTPPSVNYLYNIRFIPNNNRHLV
jgi:hypothetical protein